MVSLQLVFFCGAAVAKRSSGVGGTEYPASHIATHHAAFFFCKCILQAAIDFAVLRMQSGVGAAERNAARSSAWLALHLTPKKNMKNSTKNKSDGILLFARRYMPLQNINKGYLYTRIYLKVSP